MSGRDHKYKKPEQYHYVAPNAYQATYVAEFHDMDQVALTRGVVADVCAGSQSATHAMDMMGVPSIPMDERTQVDTGWGMIRNERLELNAGFAHDPGTSAYKQMREVSHSRGVAMGRLNVVFIAPRAPEPEGRPRGGHAYPELNRRTKRSLIAGIGDCGQ